MVSAPNNRVPFSRPGTIFVVRIGDKDGNAPTAADEFKEVIPINVELGTGGRNLDRATFEVDLGATNQRIVDFQVDPKMNRQVELYAIDENGDYEPLFWGEYDQQNLEINDQGEFVVITASVQKHHFGTPLPGPEEYNKVDDVNEIMETDIVFNPEIDGVVRGNRRDDPNNPGDFLFVDPRSAWTSAAKTYIGVSATVDKWDIESAAKALCGLANNPETLILNPDTYTVVNLAPDLKNFMVKRGMYLNEALDELLEPHGFSWFLNLEVDSLGTLEKKIHLIKQGVGVQKNVYFQRPGETLDNTKSNAPEVRVETSLSEMFNRVTVFGDFIKYQVTLELKKIWPEAQDALTPDELQKRDEVGSQFELYPNAHRKWAFNEAGDYADLRPETGTVPADLTFFGTGEEYVHKRRKAEKLLTLDNEGGYRDQYLEYYDNSQAVWKAVPPEWGYRILDDELGIYFTGNKPPSELWEQGSANIADMRLRLTCVVAGDKRMSYTAEREASSPNGRDIELVIDASDRYFKKEVHPDSTFFGVYDADEKDSTTEIQTYAEKLRSINDSANVSLNIVLFGIYHSYKRGDLIAKVDGRNISLNRNSSGVATRKFPQVTEIQWDYEEQRTSLITQLFRRQENL